MHAYTQSEYNKNCQDGILTSVSLTTKNPPLRDVIELDTTTVSSEEPQDVLPILWMERFFLVITGICVVWSFVHLVLYLVNENLTKNSTNLGVVSLLTISN